MAPDFLSTSYLTGAPPCGISMMTLTSCGGFSPTGMWERSIGVRPWLPAAVEDCHTATLARREPLPHGSRSEGIDWIMIRLPSGVRSHEHFRRNHVSNRCVPIDAVPFLMSPAIYSKIHTSVFSSVTTDND